MEVYFKSINILSRRPISYTYVGQLERRDTTSLMAILHINVYWNDLTKDTKEYY